MLIIPKDKVKTDEHGNIIIPDEVCEEIYKIRQHGKNCMMVLDGIKWGKDGPYADFFTSLEKDINNDPALMDEIVERYSDDMSWYKNLCDFMCELREEGIERGR